MDQPLKSNDPIIFNQRFILEAPLGFGSYGEVYKVKHRETGKTYALKKYKKIFSNRIMALRTLRELSILRRLKHPKIIKMYDILPPEDYNNFNELVIVLEYLPLDLRKLYKKNKFLSDEHVVGIIYQLLVVLNYLSSVKILHRDLKPQNILSDNDFNIKLCDFGLARSELLDPTFKDLQTGEPNKGMTLHVVSRWYRAPEIILMQSKYDSSIEMWSVGCIMGELIAQHKKNKKIKVGTPRIALFEGKACFPLSPPKNSQTYNYKVVDGFPQSEDDQLSKILQFLGTPFPDEITFIEEETALNYLKSLPKYQKKKPRDIFDYCLPEWEDFLEKALVFDPRKRMTVEEAIQHPIFDKIRKKEDFEFHEDFNMDIDLPSDMPMEEVRQKIIQEIKYYNSEMEIE